jgi:hypothetical protein
MKYITEICIAIDISIISIALPLISEKTATIGKSYNSINLSRAFEIYFPQKKYFRISFLNWIIYSTLLVFILLILNRPPLKFLENFWIVNNSAEKFLFIFTIILAGTFIIYLNKVQKFNHNLEVLINFLTKEYNRKSDNEIILKAINDITIYSIKQRDTTIQNTLSNFYSNAFQKERKNTSQIELEYRDDLYEVNFKIIQESLKLSSQLLTEIEYDASSSRWILGQFGDVGFLSKKSKAWLWRNINLISDNTELTKLYWENASSYYKYRLAPDSDNYMSSNEESNSDEHINLKSIHRDEFLNMNIALGGLLLFKGKYKSIEYLITYSSSIPKKHVLLFDKMEDIFLKFYEFSDKNYSSRIDLTFNYNFWGSDDIWGDERRKIIYKYLGILVINQFFRTTNYTNDNFTEFTKYPDRLSLIKSYKKILPEIKKSIKDVLTDENIKKFKHIDENKYDLIKKFISNLELKLDEEIKNRKINTVLSTDLLEQWKKSSIEIISNTINQFKFLRTKKITEEKNNKALFFLGGQTLYTKEAFSEDSSKTYTNTNTFFPELIKNKILEYLKSCFSQIITESYLIDENRLSKVINTKLKYNQNKDVIIGVNLKEEQKKLLKDFDIINITLYQRRNENYLIFCEKKSQPYLEINSIDSIEQKKLNIIKKNDNIIYAISDLNMDEHKKLLEHWLLKNDKSEQDLREHVQMNISYNAKFSFKTDSDYIKISLRNNFINQGNLTDIATIKSINNR